MRRVRVLSWVCFFLAITPLTFIYVSQGYWELAFANLIFIIPWGIGFYKDQNNLITVSFIGFILLLAAGAFLEIWIGWLVLSALFIIAAWDLYWFEHRLKSVGEIRKELDLYRSHIVRLVIALLIGLLLSITSAMLKIEINFGIALILSFVVVLGLRQWNLIASKLNR